MVSRMRLVLAQILAQTRQTSLRAIVNVSTVASENAGIAHGLTRVNTSTNRAISSTPKKNRRADTNRVLKRDARPRPAFDHLDRCQCRNHFTISKYPIAQTIECGLWVCSLSVLCISKW
jgi:hypothetical protein